MKTLKALLCVLGVTATLPAAAAAVLIKNATVHTASSAGVLEHTDVLIADGKVAELGQNLKAPAGAEVIDADGKPVTPGLFGGFSHLGIEEIGLESTVDDYSLKLGRIGDPGGCPPGWHHVRSHFGNRRTGWQRRTRRHHHCRTGVGGSAQWSDRAEVSGAVC
jgi:hypothetical protein